MSSLQYEDLPHDNISWRIWVGTLATLIPATIVVVLRFVARYVSRAGLWWDDYTIVISLVCTLEGVMRPPQGCLLIYVTGTQLGYGCSEMGSSPSVRTGKAQLPDNR